MTALGPDSWSTTQLVEFLAVLSAQDDEASALRVTVERALESLDAEVGVLFNRHSAPTVVGLVAGDPQVEAFLAAARTGADSIDITGLGKCRTATVTLDLGEDSLHIYVARAGVEEF